MLNIKFRFWQPWIQIFFSYLSTFNPLTFTDNRSVFCITVNTRLINYRYTVPCVFVLSVVCRHVQVQSLTAIRVFNRRIPSGKGIRVRLRAHSSHANGDDTTRTVLISHWIIQWNHINVYVLKCSKFIYKTIRKRYKV